MIFWHIKLYMIRFFLCLVQGVKGYLSLYIWSSGVSVNVRIRDPEKRNAFFL